MDRANVPTKVEVRQGDLRTIERTKSFHILQRLIDTAQPGIVNGLLVQQSSTGIDRFDILAGYGYTPNGEYVELEQTLEGQATGVSTGLPVLVGLMYREVETKDGAAESDGVARPREVVRASELLALTSDQWSDLPLTFDEDLSVNAQDRFLVCAIVERPFTEGDPLEITLPATFDLIKTIAVPQNLTGIVITAIDPTTNNSDPFPNLGSPSDARLRFDPATSQIAYQAPQDGTDLAQAAPFNSAGLGVPVNVSAGGTFTLTSANGTNTITIDVDSVLLPTTSVGLYVEDDLLVESLYYKTTDRFSSRDDLHRNKLGTQVPRETNPHGVRFSDIQSLLEEIIGTLKLGTAYTTSEALGDIPRVVFPANPTIDDSVEYRVAQLGLVEGVVGLLGSGKFNDTPLGWRVYRTNFDSVVFCQNCRIRNEGVNGTFERLVANGDDPDNVASMVEFSPFAIVTYAHPAASPDTWDFTTWERVQLFHSFSSSNTTLFGSVAVDGSNGAIPASLGSSAVATATEMELARLRTFFQENVAVGVRTLVHTMVPIAAVGSPVTVNVYRSNDVSGPLSGTRGWEVVWNGRWSNSAAQWTQLNTSYSTWRLMIHSGGIEIDGKGSGAAPFADGNWSTAIKLDGNGLHLGGTSGVVFDVNVQKSFTTFISTTGGEAGGTFNSVSTFVQKQAAANGIGDLYIPFRLPANAVITAVRVRTDNVVNNSGQIYATVVRSQTGGALQNLNSGGNPISVLGNTVIPDSGALQDTTLTLDQFLTIDADYLYWAFIHNWPAGVRDEDASIDGFFIDWTVPTLEGPFG